MNYCVLNHFSWLHLQVLAEDKAVSFVFSSLLCPINHLGDGNTSKLVSKIMAQTISWWIQTSRKVGRPFKQRIGYYSIGNLVEKSDIQIPSFLYENHRVSVMNSNESWPRWPHAPYWRFLSDPSSSSDYFHQLVFDWLLIIINMMPNLKDSWLAEWFESRATVKVQQ